MKVSRSLVLLLPLLAAACADNALPAASGPLRPMNAGHWTPGPNDLTAPPQAEPARAEPACAAQASATEPRS